MATADEHFQRTLDELRTHAHTKHTVYVDPEMMQFPDADIAYVRLFAFFLSSLLFFFFLLARALRKRRNKNNTRAQRVNSSFFLSRSSIADAFLFVSPSLLGAQVYGGEVSRIFHRV
jgi:hypothetical protein